jgi:thiamine-monophosphate kinase
LKLNQIGEFGWIKRLQNRLPRPGKDLLRGIGDDAAWVMTSGSTLVTCDLLIEDIHFIRDMIPPRLLGRKALSVNLSDIAAMAGVPDYAVLALGIPEDMELEYLDEFTEGFLEVAREHGVQIIGGDTSAAQALVISVTVMGTPTKKHPVLRSTARPGDEIWVTGTVGDAALGFEILKKSREQKLDCSDLHLADLAVKHFDPEPRLLAGRRLAGIAHAMIDVSDGILSDLTRILEESGAKRPLAARIHINQVPLSREFANYFSSTPLESEQALSLALSGGEDYELLFTAAPAKAPKIRKLSRELGLAMTCVGKIESAKKIRIVLLDGKGKKIKTPRPWFEHFPERKSGERP